MDLEVLDPLSDRLTLAQSLGVARRRLGKCSRRRILCTLRLHRYRLLVVARAEGRVVGFKLGFAERLGVFYSWIGAVEEAFEGQGVGRRLMDLQHTHLLENGFQRVRTTTRNEFRRMLILNLRCGFDLVGVKVKANGTAQLQLEKKLASP